MLLRIFSFSILAFTVLNGGEEILSQMKKSTLDAQKKSAILNSEKTKNSWILNSESMGSRVSYRQTTDRYAKTGVESESTSTAISLSQDVFRSGGIWYAIDYANAKKELGLTNVEMSRNAQIVAAYSALIGIRKYELSEKKQKLFIRNSELDIKRKREQYLAGLVDVSLLNSAIIGKTSQENVLLDLITGKEELIATFETMSDRDYKTVTLPKLKIPAKDKYISHNLALKSSKSTIDSADSLSKITSAKYLPKVTVSASYSEVDNQSYQGGVNGYGVSISMPISVSTFKDIEVAKLDALIAKNNHEIAKQKEEKAYDRIMQDLRRVEKKLTLAQKDMELYATLLLQTKEQYRAGLKTKDDLETMANSKKIRALDKEVYKLDILSKKLTICEKLANGF